MFVNGDGEFNIEDAQVCQRAKEWTTDGIGHVQSKDPSMSCREMPSEQKMISI